MYERSNNPDEDNVGFLSGVTVADIPPLAATTAAFVLPTTIIGYDGRDGSPAEYTTLQ